MNNKFSIIIRTKNEESWISHCLSMVYSQSIKNIEVIIVDNNSTDRTIHLAKKFPVDKIIHIQDFVPGKALNDGVRASTGDFLVFLSAHCIPKAENWLEKLFECYLSENNAAGVYGRQLPLSFTSDVDKRDLMITFGLDKKVQYRDYFFHNANSLIPKKIWESFPFDEEVTNIEDRVWGKAVIDAGYKILYEPEACVYHYHGLHQNNKPERAKGVVSIIEKVDGDMVNDLPQSLKPESINTVAILTLRGDVQVNSSEYRQLIHIIEKIKNSDYIKNIYIISSHKYFDSCEVKWIDREIIDDEDILDIENLLQKSLEIIDRSEEADSILYINHHYINEISDLYDRLVIYKQFNGFDVVFPGLIDYGHYWYLDDNDEFRQTDESLNSRNKRKPAYKALYGAGCLTSSRILRRGKLIDGLIGILPINHEIKKVIYENFE